MSDPKCPNCSDLRPCAVLSDDLSWAAMWATKAVFKIGIGGEEFEVKAFITRRLLLDIVTNYPKPEFFRSRIEASCLICGFEWEVCSP